VYLDHTSTPEVMTETTPSTYVHRQETVAEGHSLGVRLHFLRAAQKKDINQFIDRSGGLQSTNNPSSGRFTALQVTGRCGQITQKNR